jgi:hypothetical protein
MKSSSRSLSRHKTLRQAIAESRDSGHALVTDSGYVVALAAAEALLGALLLEIESPLSGPDLQNLERAAHIVSLLAFRQQAIVEAEDRVQGQLFRELASGGTPHDHQRLLAQAHGIDLDGSLAAVFARTDSGSLPRLATTLTSLARSRGGLGGEYGSGAAGGRSYQPRSGCAQAVRLRGESPSRRGRARSRRSGQDLGMAGLILTAADLADRRAGDGRPPVNTHGPTTSTRP